MIRNDQVWNKASTKRQEVFRLCEARCIHTVANVVRDAIASGDLKLPAGHAVEDLVIRLWSQVHRGMILELSSASLVDAGIHGPRRAIRRACNAILDSFVWKPLYAADKNDKWIQQVRAELTSEFENGCMTAGWILKQERRTERTSRNKNKSVMLVLGIALLATTVAVRAVVGGWYNGLTAHAVTTGVSHMLPVSTIFLGNVFPPSPIDDCRGTLQASKEADLAFRRSGRIQSILVDGGTWSTLTMC